MSEVLVEYDPIVSETDASAWKPRACGRRGEGHMWEGWIEFVSLEPLKRASLRSGRESTQPSRESLLYWATGLTPVYLRGALDRARHEPAPRPPVRRAGLPQPILDPFDVYAQGEDILVRQLDALDTPRLRDIARAYELMGAPDADSATRSDLATAIIAAARAAAYRV